MALPALRFEPENSVEDRMTRLEVNVENIQTYVSEIKTEIRRLDNKIDEVDKRLTGKIEVLDQKLSEGLDALKAAIADLRVGRANDRVWWLTIAAALIGVMAHGFKWI